MFYPSPQRPARFRRPRLLIVDCGDVGLRVVKALAGRYRITALSSQPQRAAPLRAAGVTPLWGDLDRPATLGRLAALAPRVLHLAPPPAVGRTDTRTRHLLHVLARGGTVQRFVYGSTTGVYGDAQGARFDETRLPAPATPRARRRADAEAQLRWWGRAMHACASVLRIPGIYAADRSSGDARARLLQRTPVWTHEDDVYTNHIHADDLARACVRALHRGRPQRVVHVCDDTEMKMGDYFDLVADRLGLPRPPRVPRGTPVPALSLAQLSFMNESRRLDNRRLKRELGLRLRYPTVRQGLAAAADE